MRTIAMILLVLDVSVPLVWLIGQIGTFVPSGVIDAQGVVGVCIWVLITVLLGLINGILLATTIYENKNY